MLTVQLKAQLSGVIKSDNVRVTSIKDAFSSNDFTSQKVEVILTENDLKVHGTALLDALKALNIEPSVIILDGDLLGQNHGDFTSEVIVLGSSGFINGVINSAPKSVKFFIVPTSPLLEELESAVIIIDESIILKASNEEYAKAFLSVINKPLALIDFKLNAYLTGSSAENEWFSTVKNAVSVASKLTKYSNYKQAIILAEAMLLWVNLNSNVLSKSGESAVYSATKLFMPELKGSHARFISLEKTLKLYHLLFSNDYSALLSSPNYTENVKLLAEKTGKDPNEYVKNLKVPKKRRLELIYLLLDKTRDSFIKETGAMLSVLGGIKKIYLAIIKEKETIIPYYKDIKNAVTVAPYITSAENALTLCRDLGVLQCAN
ncbi:MAG: hypothetical protein IKL82_02830 [Clostridia bacterium]|nr:hypothetical protein [Clostridia bacterium]